MRHLAQPRDFAGRQAFRMDSEQMSNRGEAGRLRKRSKAFDGTRFSMVPSIGLESEDVTSCRCIDVLDDR
jgi:hypothetical protein